MFIPYAQDCKMSRICLGCLENHHSNVTLMLFEFVTKMSVEPILENAGFQQSWKFWCGPNLTLKAAPLIGLNGES